MVSCLLFQNQTQLPRNPEGKSKVAQHKSSLFQVFNDRSSIHTDPSDHAKEETDIHLQFDLEERAFCKQREYQLAQKKLEHGEKFGVCQSCEQEIEPRRMKVIPTASFCIECQSQIESRTTPTLRPKYSDYFTLTPQGGIAEVAQEDENKELQALEAGGYPLSRLGDVPWQ